MTISTSQSSVRVPFLQLRTDARQNKTLEFVSESVFNETYVPFQALHIRGFVPLPLENAGKFRACDAQTLFESLSKKDKESWCIEGKEVRSQNDGNEKASTISPHDFLDANNKNHRGYCSFLVQHSEKVMNDLLPRLPMAHLPVKSGTEPGKNCVTMKVHYGPCLWMFFGKNYGSSSKIPPAPLQGRTEHTDSVTHDGTWHYQLSGTKIWRLRPTTQLMRKIKEHRRQKGKPLSGAKRTIDDANGNYNCEISDENVFNYCDEEGKEYIEVECKQGDILLLNTKLWWHSTLLPSQDAPSISYARDAFFPSKETSDAGTEETLNVRDVEKNGQKRKNPAQLDQEESSMINIDGTYAAEDIEADTVLFSEHTMPNCELHRSKTNPNCEVVELEDEETGETYMAVVSLREIKAGEFFCMLQSDAEEDGSDVETEEWEELNS